MTPMLLAEIAAKSFVVAGAALALLAIVRNRSAAERSWLAHAGVVVLLALPAAALLLPRWSLLGPRATAPMSAGELSAAAATPGVDTAMWMQAAYVAGAVFLLLSTAVAVARLFRLGRRATVLTDAGWLTAFARAQARMGVKSGAALLVSPAITSPVSWGLLRPTIVLNEGLIEARGDAEAIIAHELAHVVRRDWAKLLFGRVAVALFWFNPLVWILARQCHQLREEAADDAVLRSNVKGADYANLLIEAARHECRDLIAAHGVAPSRNSLHRRVTRVLDAAARRTPTTGGWASACLLGATVAAAPLAAATLERPTVAQPAPQTTVPAAPKEPTVTVTSSFAAKPAAVDVTSAKSAPAAVTVHRSTTFEALPAAPTATATSFRASPAAVGAPASTTSYTGAARVGAPAEGAPAAVTFRKAEQRTDNARSTSFRRAEEKARDRQAEAPARAREKQAEALARQIEAGKRQAERKMRLETREAESRTEAPASRSAAKSHSLSISANGVMRVKTTAPGKTTIAQSATVSGFPVGLGTVKVETPRAAPPPAP